MAINNISIPATVINQSSIPFIKLNEAPVIPATPTHDSIVPFTAVKPRKKAWTDLNPAPVIPATVLYPPPPSVSFLVARFR